MYFEEILNEVKFRLRERYFGKLSLRVGLPYVSLSDRAVIREEEYYKLILTTWATRVTGATGLLNSTEGLGSSLSTVSQVIDVGCRNWSYVGALSQFFPDAHLTGLEVDGRRRYWNLYRRMDLAQAYAQELQKRHSKRVLYLNKDFRSLDRLEKDSNVAFCFFFPYVSENPCLKGGLPSRFADFKVLLMHSLQLATASESKARWISSHQGDWEIKIARKAYQDLGLSVQEFILKVEDFKSVWPSQFDTHIIVASSL